MAVLNGKPISFRGSFSDVGAIILNASPNGDGKGIVLQLAELEERRFGEIGGLKIGLLIASLIIDQIGKRTGSVPANLRYNYGSRIFQTERETEERVDVFSGAESGWALVEHFIGNQLLAMRLSIEAHGKAFADEVEAERIVLLERLIRTIARMYENGLPDDATKVAQIARMVERCNPTSLTDLEEIERLHGRLSLTKSQS